MKEKVKEIEAILKVSGIANGFPDMVRRQVCHSVAVDLFNYFSPKGEKPPVLSNEERKAIIDKHMLDNPDLHTAGQGLGRKMLEAQRDTDALFYEAKMHRLQVDIETLSHAQEVLSKKLDDVDIAIEQAKQMEGEVILLQLVERLGYEISQGHIIDGDKILGEASFEIFMRLVEQKIEQARQEAAEKLEGLMETIELMFPELRQSYWEGENWQALKDSYKEKEE